MVGWLVGLDLMLLSCYMNLGPLLLQEDQSEEMKRDSDSLVFTFFFSEIKPNIPLLYWKYKRLTSAQDYTCVNPPSSPGRSCPRQAKLPKQHI